MTKRHPSQPVEIVDGVIRFKKNAIVYFLLDAGGFNLNNIISMVHQGAFSKDDYDQLMQLIGYSVSGYRDLSTSDQRRGARAQKQGMKLLEKEG